ncbi:hypothetical protein EJ110_NYTH34313 [Nymphaea thermarum]|nr:hypothetical protein EJ110_NYTH34313 [Nymphaea thermarum]
MEINQSLIVTSWLINSMESKIAEGFYFADIASQIWKKTKALYNEKNDIACFSFLKIFEALGKSLNNSVNTLERCKISQKLGTAG